jgi:hypothetical protein
MTAKPALGYPTQTALKAAVKAIVTPYPTGAEFFDPLLQRLFVERPYDCDPPGPTYTNFKYDRLILPNGKVWDRIFKAFNEDFGWRRRSWNKCVDGVKNDFERRLNRFARWRALMIVARYRDTSPACEWQADDDHCGRIIVHHMIPMRRIIDDAIERMTREETSALSKELYLWERTDDFEILDHHKFTQRLLERHAEPGCLRRSVRAIITQSRGSGAGLR